MGVFNGLVGGRNAESNSSLLRGGKKSLYAQNNSQTVKSERIGEMPLCNDKHKESG